MLFEDQQRNKRSGNDLKVVQQGCIGGRGAGQTQHQKDGGGNVQRDHGKGIGKFLAGQGCANRVMTQGLAGQPVEQQAEACTQIEERGHHGGTGVGQQFFGEGRVQCIQRSGQNGQGGA